MDGCESFLNIRSTLVSTPPSNVPLTAPVTIYNARIADLAPTVVTEQIADNIQFTYNPLTQAGAFAFTSRQFVYVNGQPQSLSGTSPHTLQVDASTVLTEKFGVGLADPVTGMDLSNLSVAGVDVFIKNAFDILFNRKAKTQSTPTATQAYPSALAIMQANTLYDLFGNGLGGFPLGKAFGGLGTSDGTPSTTPLPTPPNPITSP